MVMDACDLDLDRPWIIQEVWESGRILLMFLGENNEKKEAVWNLLH